MKYLTFNIFSQTREDGDWKNLDTLYAVDFARGEGKIVASQHHLNQANWSPDSHLIILTYREPSTWAELWIMHPFDQFLGGNNRTGIIYHAIWFPDEEEIGTIY